jgi:uncharacterized RDD family membrane protein YckC
MSTQTPGSTPLPAAENAAPQTPRRIGALWRRVLAFVIDCTILSTIGNIVAWPFTGTLIAMGPVARLVGFFIALLYFAFPESSIGGGASIGKRFLLLQVAHRDGSLLTLEESLGRYIVFAVPYFLNGLPLPLSRTPWAVIVLLRTVELVAGGITLYMILFNRHTRQGLHDLSMDCFVAESGRHGAITAEPIWKPHWLIAGVALLQLAWTLDILGVVLIWGPWTQFTKDIRAVEQIDGVQSAGIARITTYNRSEGWKLASLAVTIHCLCKEGEEGSVADDVARALLQRDPHFQDYPRLTITVLRGYDMGIAASMHQKRFSNTPSGWSNWLLGASPSTEAH